MSVFKLRGTRTTAESGETNKELELVNPKLTVPCYRTGGSAMCTYSNKLPIAFVWNSARNLYEI